MRSHLLRVHTRDDLVAVRGPDDVFARLDPPAHLTGWTLGDSVAYIRTSSTRQPSLFAWGRQVGALLDGILHAGAFEEHLLRSVSVPVERGDEIAHRFVVIGGGDWDWMWCDESPCQVPHEDLLIALDDIDDAEEISAFGRSENPLFEGFVGTGSSENWVGARDGGRLIACGAVQRLPSGVAHLGGIVVAREFRGTGLGRAVSAALTRRVITTEGVCTLGMYSDNTVARRLYRSLHYIDDTRWASRSIATTTTEKSSRRPVQEGIRRRGPR